MLTSLQKRALKQQAHHLKPVVLLGQHGLTDAVLAAIEEALEAHELIKIQLAGVEREQLDAIQQAICQPMNAEVICCLGHKLVIYRKNPLKVKATVAPPAKRMKKIDKKRTAKHRLRR